MMKKLILNLELLLMRIKNNLKLFSSEINDDILITKKSF
jgi:hypothetical protein